MSQMSSFAAKISTEYGKYAVSKDGGYAEQFQYIQFAGVILFLALLAARAKSALIGAWVVIFSILLADDKLALHETWGAYIAGWFSFQPLFRLRAVDYGEMTVFALWGLISLSLLSMADLIDQSTIGLRVSKALFLSLVGFAFFGAFFDMLHIVVLDTYTLTFMQNNIFDAIEDGGEMIVISLVLWFVYRTFVESSHNRQSKG